MATAVGSSFIAAASAPRPASTPPRAFFACFLLGASYMKGKYDGRVAA